MKIFFRHVRFIGTLFLLLLVISCEKEEETTTNVRVKEFIYGVMQEWYLWNNSLPTLDVTQYTNPQNLVINMRHELDKWSFIDKTETVNAVFQEGEEFGFGFHLGWDSYQNSLRVMFAYENTTAYKMGVRRGWNLLEIDGIHVFNIDDFSPFFDNNPRTMKFKFLNLSGEEVILPLINETYNKNGVMHQSTYSVNSKTVGYMVYHSFLGYSEVDLKSAISYFKNEGIDDFIIDLRFNQGGYISLTKYLSDIVAPQSADKGLFFEMKHNADRSEEFDTSYSFNIANNNLGLERIFFFTNKYTASASELLINGLKPHYEVITVGDSTYGKPVAMYGFEYEDWLFYPVTAKSVNANGYGDYFGGILPDYLVVDNFYYDWGDTQDPLLAKTLNYIESGIFYSASGTIVKSEVYPRKNVSDSRLNQNMLIMDR